jgi:hypothetical protein
MSPAILRRSLLCVTSLAAACGIAACSATSSLPSAPQASTAARSHDQSDSATAVPIGARAIPIGARAIPIGARAIPINFTTTPQLAAVCGSAAGAACGSIRRLDITPALDLVADLIAGYQPDDLQLAYNVPIGQGGGQTIGIVVAMNDPNAASDLAVYRSTFGLPPCTTSSGCLRIVAQNGSTSLPASDQSWAQELSIDLDMASAICPNCKLLVVEANSADIDNLTASVATAVSKGATVVSNSYSTPETAATAAENSEWNHPGVPIVAGAGDNGYGVGWPASSSYVTAVGGTTLLPVVEDTMFLETAWADTGSGCSAYIAKPSWQHDALCKRRTVNDVAAIANPVPGVAVYDTYFASSSNAGWNVFGGTSVATPIVAAMYALAGNGTSVNSAQGIYQHPSALNNIILGANALCLTYLCTSGLGYSGPTGLGTPNGTAAF